MKPKVDGFLNEAKVVSTGEIYTGRFTCNDVQLTGEGADLLATFTVTSEELTDAADGRLLYTDQDVQRGIKPGLGIAPPKELPLGDGYPNEDQYIFDTSKADDITEKLLAGERLFLSPLVWNLRPGSFEAYWDRDKRKIYLYSGKIYLPDSHHRQQAIRKAVHAWREHPQSYPKFSDRRQFKVELYFLSKDGEGDYFFDKNQRPKPTAKSKAYDLTTSDDLSLLAKKVIEKSLSLQNNVNRVTDRLSPRNPQVITLSTLREMMKSVVPGECIDIAEMEGLSTVAASFYDLITSIRPELGHIDAVERRRVREGFIVDAAVMMHGYAALMRDYNDAIAILGVSKAKNEWQTKLSRFSSSVRYYYGDWSGDLFEKRNPLWQALGIVKPSRDGRNLTVLNTGAVRSECGRVLRQLSSVTEGETNLLFLSRR